MHTERIVNLTGHRINILDENDDQIASFPPADTQARVDERGSTKAQVSLGDDIEVEVMSQSSQAPITGLPDPRPGTSYIVSTRVLEAALALGRPTDDLLVPAQVVMYGQQWPIGCRRLRRVVASGE